MRALVLALVPITLLGCRTFDASTDFDPAVDALAFENFGEVAGPALVGSTQMIELFGADAACHDGTVTLTGCTLLPEAEQWQLQVNHALGGGRCDGFATYAQLADGDLDGLLLDDALGRAIARDAASQFTADVRQATEAVSAFDAANRLLEELSDGDIGSRIGIVRTVDGAPAGGHALVPYGLEQQGDGTVDVLVYDPNHPGDERRLNIDRAEDTWSYLASTTPNDATADYSGSVVRMTSATARTGEHACPWCDTDEWGTTVIAGGPGAATVSDCTDGAGALGASADGFVWSSALGAAAPSFSGLWSDAAPLSFDLEAAAGDVCVDFAGRAAGLGETDDLAISVLRPGRSVAAVSGAAQEAAWTLQAAADGRSATLTTGATWAGFLTAGAQVAEDLHVTAKVDVGTVEGGQTLTVSIAEETGDVVVTLTAEEAQTVRAEIVRVAAGDRDEYVGVLDGLDAGAELTFAVSGWANDGDVMTIAADYDGDGTSDATFEADDCDDPLACEPLFGGDGDFVADDADVCPRHFDPGQEDQDGDGVGDACDPCPADPTCSCAAGSWDDDGDNETACVPCEAGEYCAGGSEEPVACEDATFDHDADPATACRACDDGFSSDDGLTCE